MKEIHFYILFAILAAVQSGLIFAGFLPTLSSYSANNIFFSLIVIAATVYMGWDLAKLGMKKVAMNGAAAALVRMAVISVASVVGHIIEKPVLGVQLPSVYYLPILLLSMLLPNIVLYTFFAVLGAGLAQRFKPSQKSKKKR